MSQESVDSIDVNDSQLFSIEELIEICAEDGIGVQLPSRGNEPKVDKDEDIVSNSSIHQCTRSQNEEPESVETGQLHLNKDQLEAQDIYQEYSPGGKKRKGKKFWKRSVNYEKRMYGQQYVGFDTGESAKKKRITPQTKERQAREMGPPCSSTLCARRSSRNCNKFSYESRQLLFNEFWTNMTWKEKQSHVKSLVDQKDPSRHKKGQSHLRKAIGPISSTWMVKKPSTKKGSRSVSTTRKGGDSNFARNYLLDIPKLPSHYCRGSCTKLYLEPIIRTKFQLYKLYKSKCVEDKADPVSLWKFDKLFEELNIAIHQPKKDWCDTCCSYESGQLSQADYDNHVKLKDAAWLEKTNDKAFALQGKCHLISMDLQGVLLAPVLNASALYYKTKLAIHNFTIFDLKTRAAKCYLWDESEAGLIASVFASCLVAYLNEHYQDDLPIIIFSDGCTNQNRNAVLSNAISNYAVENKKVVIQKYLEKGHTQMEVDSVHACIEKALKGRPIYVPTDYIDACRRARTHPTEYTVQYMSFKDFKNYSLSENMHYTSIRPGSKKDDPHVTDLRQLRYNPDGLIDYKLQHSDDWKSLPRIPKKLTVNKYSALYQDKLPLTKRKHQDLMDLLHVIPVQYHEFYRSLPVHNN